MILIFILFLFAGSYTIPIYIGKISSRSSSFYKYDPYSFPICKKSRIKNENKKAKSFAINFAGNSMSDIGLNFENMVNIEKKSLCTRGMSKDNYIDMKNAISQDVYIEFIINGSFSTSVPLGTVDQKNNFFYFSHWDFNIYNHGENIVFAHASSSDPLPLSFESDLQFTYSVSLTLINNLSALKAQNEDEVQYWYHYYSLLKFSVYVISAVGVLGFLIIEKITNDINDFKNDAQFDDFDDSHDQFHWRLLHGDIFRCPKNISSLSSIVGTSFHIIFTFLIAIILYSITNFFDSIGFFNLFLIIYSTSSFLSGYSSISVSSQFGYKKFYKSALSTSFVFAIPILILMFLLTIITNSFFSTFKNCFYFFISVLILILPLSVFGGYFGSTNHIFECPCDVAAIPRKQPKLPILLRNYILFPIIGCICSFLFIYEFDHILDAYSKENNGWFLTLFSTVFFVSIFYISAISIALVYILMKQECYSWQWPSFLAPFCSSFFLFVYLYNYVSNLSMFQNILDYFAAILVSLAGSYLFGLVCGGVGYLSANIFIQIIFSNLKFS